MNQEEVIQVMSAMNDYADKQNNSGMKNIVLVALITIVTTASAGIIGWLTKELYDLRAEKEDLKAQVLRLEMKHDAALEEQNKVMFEMIQGMEKVSKRVPKPDKEPVVKLPDPERTKKFDEYHKMFEQRIQHRLPPEQRTLPKEVK